MLALFVVRSGASIEDYITIAGILVFQERKGKTWTSKESDLLSLMQVKHSEIAASHIEATSAKCPVLRILGTIVFFNAVALMACLADKPEETPAIAFTGIPPAALGGRERVDRISGRVRGARAKQQIVIYAHGRQWSMPWPPYLGS